MVDNGSQDDSIQFVQTSFPSVKIILNGENLGFAGGCNVGIRAAQGEYIVFLNPDTVAEETWLAELVSAAEEDEQIGIVMSKILLFDQRDVINTSGNELHYLGFGWAGNFGVKDEGQFEKREIAAASGASMLVKRKVADEVGLFDSLFFMYQEDADFSWRARLRGYRVVFAPASVAYHKYTFDKGMHKFYYLERNRLMMVLKNYSFKMLVLITPVLLFCEAGMLLYFLLTRGLKIKLRSYTDLVRQRGEILAKRRVIQRNRKVNDREITKLFASKVSSEGVKHLLQSHIANPIYSLYWAVVRRLI